MLRAKVCLEVLVEEIWKWKEIIEILKSNHKCCAFRLKTVLRGVKGGDFRIL
jgi:hypothetical protein